MNEKLMKISDALLEKATDEESCSKMLTMLT